MDVRTRIMRLFTLGTKSFFEIHNCDPIILELGLFKASFNYMVKENLDLKGFQ